MSATTVKPKSASPTNQAPAKQTSNPSTKTEPAKPAQPSKPAQTDSSAISKEANNGGSRSGNECRALLQGLQGWASGGETAAANGPSSTSSQPNSTSDSGGYTVKSGDTLWDIAQRNGTDLASLLEANPQFRANPDLIHPGDQVNLPGSGQSGGNAPSVVENPGGGNAPVEPAPAPPSTGETTAPPTTSGNAQGDPIGLAALNYGADGQTVNPNTGDTNWYMWCLGWTNRAIHGAGGDVPELRAGTASQAYQNALDNGKIQYGNPPPGAIVFFPQAADGVGHVGIVGEDGTNYRGTVPPSESATTIGDRPIPGLDQVAWMLPSG